MNALSLLLATLLWAVSWAQSCTRRQSTECLATLFNTVIQGKNTGSACRYTIQYAQAAERWGYSWILTTLSNASTVDLPVGCPQSSGSYLSGATFKEDCLFATVYAPADAHRGSKLPVFVWIHGGSFVAGSASAPGLDGSHLANKGMIVVVLQYRLGVLGFLPPSLAASSGDPNLGVLDVLNGLKSVQTNIASFGGDPFKVTVGGESSGAGIIRTLLGAPSATGLFRAAVLQSDPMSYGLASVSTTAQLREAYYASDSVSSCKTLQCLQQVSVADLLEAQDDLLSYAPLSLTGIPLAEVIRPTHGTTIIPYDPTPRLFSTPQTLYFIPSYMPLLITTTKNEGGAAIQNAIPVPVPATNETFTKTLTTFFGSNRSAAIAKAYPLLSNVTGTDTLRETFEKVATDGIWRCPNRQAALAWSAAGGHAWVGEWLAGSTYADDQGTYCSPEGRVCHEDDIYPTFGSAPGNSLNTLQEEIASRWVAFVTSLDPNTRGQEAWSRYSESSGAHGLGGDQVQSCNGAWGGDIPYDWQLNP